MRIFNRASSSKDFLSLTVLGIVGAGEETADKETLRRVRRTEMLFETSSLETVRWVIRGHRQVMLLKLIEIEGTRWIRFDSASATSGCARTFEDREYGFEHGWP